MEKLRGLKVEWDANQTGALSRVPLYHQIYSVLKDAILGGTIIFGEKIATELQIAEVFQVSRITAKRALDELAAEKLIARQRGKGSHVIHKWVPSPVKIPLIGMLQNMTELFHHSSTKSISIEQSVPDSATGAELGLEENEKVHRVIRVHSNEDGEPYVYYESWTVGIKRGFTERSLRKHSRLEMIKHNGINLVRVEQTLSAEPATRRVASALDVAPGVALLSLTRRSFDASGGTVDILHGLYNPRLFKYLMELTLE